MLDKSYKDLKKKKKCFTLKIKGFYYGFTMIIFFCKGIKVIFSYFFSQQHAYFLLTILEQLTSRLYMFTFL